MQWINSSVNESNTGVLGTGNLVYTSSVESTVDYESLVHASTVKVHDSSLFTNSSLSPSPSIDSNDFNTYTNIVGSTQKTTGQVTTPPSNGSGGGVQEMCSLPLPCVPMVRLDASVDQ